MKERVDKTGGVTALGRELLALEIAGRTTNNTCDDDDSNGRGSISSGSDKHRKLGVPVKNISDAEVEGRQSRLSDC